jgi:hypothetical protein
VVVIAIRDGVCRMRCVVWLVVSVDQRRIMRMLMRNWQVDVLGGQDRQHSQAQSGKGRRQTAMSSA